MQSVTADVTANCSFSLLALTFRFSPKENHIVENELHHVDGLKFNACYSLSFYLASYTHPFFSIYLHLHILVHVSLSSQCIAIPIPLLLNL
jgi:hypothetical protein